MSTRNLKRARLLGQLRLVFFQGRGILAKPLLRLRRLPLLQDDLGFVGAAALLELFPAQLDLLVRLIEASREASFHGLHMLEMRFPAPH